MNEKREVRDPLPEELRTERAALPGGLRVAGVFVAWAAGSATAWGVAGRADLLEAVLRGAGVLVAALVLWFGGITVSERLLDRGRAGAAGERDSGKTP